MTAFWGGYLSGPPLPLQRGAKTERGKRMDGKKSPTIKPSDFSDQIVRVENTLAEAREGLRLEEERQTNIEKQNREYLAQIDKDSEERRKQSREFQAKLHKVSMGVLSLREIEVTEALAANKRLDSTRDAVETIESHAVASPAPPQVRVAGTRKGAAPTDNLIPVAGSSEERAQTVARIIAELNTLEPQMYGEETYENLKKNHPDFLTFAVSEQRDDLKVLLVNIQESKRHIRLAQQCAAHYHGRNLETIKSDWKHHKPENFRSRESRKTRRKKRKNKA